MSTEDITKIIAGLLTMNGNLVQLLTTQKERTEWVLKANNQLGDLGMVYRIIIQIPLAFNKYTILLLLFLSFSAVVAGTLMIYEVIVPSWLAWINWIFENSILIGIIYATFVLIPVQFNLLSQIKLSIFKKMDRFDLLRKTYFRFNVGWINANWQLNHYEKFFAMNINDRMTQKNANLIFNLMKSIPSGTLIGRAMQPQDLSQAEHANHLLFKVAVEKPIHQLYPRNSGVLDDSHKYLAWIANSSRRMYSPEFLREFNDQQNNLSYYQHLRSQANGNQPEGSLPHDILIDQIVQDVFEKLVEKYNGNAFSLAINRLHRDGSATKLLKELDNFNIFSESYKRLYLKLCVRMNVWPNMNPGPFLFPYANGIAIYFLNSHSIEVASDIERIDVEDDFKAIVAATENQICDYAYNMMLDSASQPETKNFTGREFNVSPLDVNRWAFYDRLDFWLWSQTKNHCAMVTKTSTGNDLDCNLLASGSKSECFCDLTTKRWQLSGDTLIIA